MGFYLFGAFIPYYGLCIALGIVCAIPLTYFLCKKQSANFNDCIIVCAYLIGFGFLGAKLLYIAVSYKTINFIRLFKDLKYLNAVINSGFVFYGGFLAGIFSLFIVKKVHKINVSPYIQILSPAIALAHGFGRVGCSLAGCCYGKISKSAFCFMYMHSLIAPNNQRLVPVQGIEAFFLFGFSILFTILILNPKIKINTAKLYIMLYAILRFFLEFYRGDSARGKFGLLSTSQIISVILFLFILTGASKNLVGFLEVSDKPS